MTIKLYLDHNASSPARPEVIDAMRDALLTHGNASAPHGFGRAARKLVEDGREAVALAMGVCAQDLIFTASGTESVNTAIKSAVDAGCKRLLVSSMDHPAAFLMAEAVGTKVDFIPANSNGQLDMNWLADVLANWDAADGKPFVSIVAANSETGVLQDIERATDMTQAVGGLILVDAVQALGKIPMVFMPDYLAVSAHKIGGPQGVGALYAAPDAPYTSMMIGGGQEKRRRAGTLNVAGIAGFGAAAKTISNGAISDLNHVRTIRDAIESGLKAMEPGLVIFGENVERLPNTSFFAVPDTASSTLMMALDLEGISVSTGLACSSGKTGASRAVTAMGLSDKAPKGAIRISLGYTSKPEDADIFLNAWAKIRRRSKSNALKGAA
jgi:cysteine desulfurase